MILYVCACTLGIEGKVSVDIHFAAELNLAAGLEEYPPVK